MLVGSEKEVVERLLMVDPHCHAQPWSTSRLGYSGSLYKRLKTPNVCFAELTDLRRGAIPLTT